MQICRLNEYFLEKFSFTQAGLEITYLILFFSIYNIYKLKLKIIFNIQNNNIYCIFY